jgi:hypothetical protein
MKGLYMVKKPKATAKALGALVADLSHEDLLVLTDSDRRKALKQWLDDQCRSTSDVTHGTPLTLADIITPLPDALFTDAEEGVADSFGFTALLAPYAATLRAWRAAASSLDVAPDVPVAYLTYPGFTLKEHLPQVGPCDEDWTYLQNWPLTNDQPTGFKVLFWIPRLVPGSTDKTVNEQRALLAAFREKHAFPNSHCASFGSAVDLAALIVAHHAATDERVPCARLYARTDTFHADGYRLSLGSFGAVGLSYGGWDWDVNRDYDLGCFPLGLQPLGA